MKKFIASILSILLLAGSWPLNAPAYGATLKADSRSELIDIITAQVQKHAESFAIDYHGNRNLANDNILTDITEFDGSERNTMLQSVYGLESIEGRLRYVEGTDIQFTFTADYNHTKSEAARLDSALQSWVDNNLSPDMYGAAKTAIITQYLSQRLEYLLDSDSNNAYYGYYGLNTACSGYAELTWLLLKKAGLPVRMIAGYTPDGLTDTEFLALDITSADLLAFADADPIQQMQTLHVWNMVQIGGKWYQLDTTWVDGDRNGEPEDGTSYPTYFLGSDRDFARSHGWIDGEYPVAPANWWDEGDDALRDFLKAYMNTQVYDYPAVTSLKQLNAFVEDAYSRGRSSQTFRITQGVQAYDVFPTLGSARDKVIHSRSDYRETPRYSGDSYLLTLDFRGRDAGDREALPATVSALKAGRGDLIDPKALLKDPKASEAGTVKWIPLSPSLIGIQGQSLIALKEGRGYVGAYTRDEAVIIPVDITLPELQVFLNGSPLDLSPNPVILQGRTLVPLRGIFEAMGASVTYDPVGRTITGTRGSDTVFLTLGSPRAVINGVEILLDVPPQIMGDRAFVPARLIAESFGAAVAWDGLGNRVLITDSNP